MLSCEPQKIVNRNQKKEKEKGIVWLQEGYPIMPNLTTEYKPVQSDGKEWPRLKFQFQV